ncbi:unnamed protein product [Leptidea sinapis]|uniref:Ig-like domain-containing protein n=1 Tax=Leptidea sinapis TaxID=189913 RepID=A0A5E4R1I6_9NEOP|nr:unnamed protein product [Leptidea sinapis]
MHSWSSLYLLGVFMLGLDSKLAGEAFQPEFAEPIGNLTVSVGRDATFHCLVHNLGGYRVRWMGEGRYESNTGNSRACDHKQPQSSSVPQRAVRVESTHQERPGRRPGSIYMGYLDVVVPPDFVSEETSGDVMIPEGDMAKLSCRARGQPAPLHPVIQVPNQLVGAPLGTDDLRESRWILRSSDHVCT